jgi:hypothetical protein
MSSVNLSNYEIHVAEYPVFNFHEILSPQLFEELSKEFPSLSSMSEHKGELFAECHSSDPAGQFHQFCAERPSLGKLRDLIQSDGFVSQVTRFLVANRQNWPSSWSFFRLVLRTKLNRVTTTVSLHSGVRGYGLTPHTDKGDKFAALIIYLGSSDCDAVNAGGTTFYTPSNDGLARRFLRKHGEMNQGVWRFVPFRLLPLVSVGLPRIYSDRDCQNQATKALSAEFHQVHRSFFVSEFRANSGALFFKDQLTWHEVNLVNFPPHEVRRSILINLYCVPALPRRIFQRLRAVVRPNAT